MADIPEKSDHTSIKERISPKNEVKTRWIKTRDRHPEKRGKTRDRHPTIWSLAGSNR